MWLSRPYLYGHACIYGHFGKIACISPVFLWFYPYFCDFVQVKRVIELLQLNNALNVHNRGEYMSKKISNCLPWNLEYLETVCPGQPKNLQNCLSKHEVNIFQAMVKNIIDSHCALHIKETEVCVWVDLLPRRHNFLHLFGPKLSITSKNFWNCPWVCLGSETVCPEKAK